VIDHKTRRERRRKIAEFVAARNSSAESLPAAVEKFGVTEYTVRASCREHGVEPPARRERRKRPVVLGNPTYDVIAALCNTADTYAVIGERLGVSKQWIAVVYAKCKAAGVPVKNRGKK
jgi:hypothetical protein